MAMEMEMATVMAPRIDYDGATATCDEPEMRYESRIPLRSSLRVTR